MAVGQAGGEHREEHRAAGGEADAGAARRRGRTQGATARPTRAAGRSRRRSSPRRRPAGTPRGRRPCRRRASRPPRPPRTLRPPARRPWPAGPARRCVPRTGAGTAPRGAAPAGAGSSRRTRRGPAACARWPRATRARGPAPEPPAGRSRRSWYCVVSITTIARDSRPSSRKRVCTEEWSAITPPNAGPTAKPSGLAVPTMLMASARRARGARSVTSASITPVLPSTRPTSGTSTKSCHTSPTRDRSTKSTASTTALRTMIALRL